MLQLTSEGEERIAELAERHGVSVDAVRALLEALVKGNGIAAQFHHPELGGMGQWMRGGMTQIADMFNSALKARVESLCAALSALLAASPSIVAPATGGSEPAAPFRDLGGPTAAVEPGRWWPPELGTPASTGAQNHARYAYFPGARRLAVEAHGTLTVYDTLDHGIQGVSQQQGTEESLCFISRKGPVDLASLPIVHRSSRPEA
jgi:hypothetical protein